LGNDNDNDSQNETRAAPRRDKFYFMKVHHFRVPVGIIELKIPEDTDKWFGLAS